MGCYINPGINPPEAVPFPPSAQGAKEAWLQRHATRLPAAPVWGAQPDGSLPVCWVDNGRFTAAIVCYKPSELDEVKADIGPRPFRWYFAPVAELLKVSPLAEYLARYEREKA